jgi:hypothetical protein
MSTIDSIAEFISSTIRTIVLANNKMHLKRMDMGKKNKTIRRTTNTPNSWRNATSFLMAKHKPFSE